MPRPAGHVVELRSVTKTRGSRGQRIRALDQVSLAIEAGSATAIIGANGSGKSSLLRLAVGLDHPDEGEVRLLGEQIRSRSQTGIGRVGCLIDRPGVVPGLSAVANLDVLARLLGIASSRVGEVVQRCGLSSADAMRPVSTYSLGMRQRLGIAMALLADPEILILDEPTNGLDPGGIAWVRDLIRTEVAAGHTVVLASHLVSEVERVCDRVVVLHRGRVVRAGRMDEVLATLAVPHLLEVAGTAAAARVALAAAGIDLAPVSLGDVTTLVIRSSLEELAAITVALGRAGIAITHLAPEVPILEVLLQEVRRDG